MVGTCRVRALGIHQQLNRAPAHCSCPHCRHFLCFAFHRVPHLLFFLVLGEQSDLPVCSGADRIRLICMGKGFLMPDTRTLEDCQVPVFQTHPTPINVSVQPEANKTTSVSTSRGTSDTPGRPTVNTGQPVDNTASQGCACTIL